MSLADQPDSHQPDYEQPDSDRPNPPADAPAWRVASKTGHRILAGTASWTDPTIR